MLCFSVSVFRVPALRRVGRTLPARAAALSFALACPVTAFAAPTGQALPPPGNPTTTPPPLLPPLARTPGTMPPPPAAIPPGAAAGDARPQTVIRRVVVEGARAVKAERVVAAATTAVAGRAGTSQTIVAATRAVRDLYRAGGFPVAQVIAAEVEADGTLRLTVAEGVVRSIIIRGNRKTREAVVRDVLTLKPGDTYQEDKVRDDRNRLARLGVFSEVVITAQTPGTPLDDPATLTPPDETRPESTKDGKSGDGKPADGKSGDGKPADDTPPAAPVVPVSVATTPPPTVDEVGQVDLVVRIKERQSVNIAATVGYADSIGAVGFVDLSEVNLAGTAQRLAVQWQRTTNSFTNPDGSVTRGDARQAFDLGYERPALGVRSTAYSAEIYNKNTVFLPFFTGGRDSIRTFERRNGATLRVGRQVAPNLTVYGTARHDEVGYDAIPDYLQGVVNFAIPTNLLARANARIGALGGAFVYDARDARDNPQRGTYNELAFERSGRFLGGNRPYNQATLDLRGYRPLSGGSPSRPGDTTAPPASLRPVTPPPATVLALRLLGGYSSGGNVPLSEQFFLGGYDLLRGYDLYSVYGDRMVLGTGEVRIPAGAGVQAVVFVDAGNAYQPGQTFGSGGLKTGVGVGLRFLSPIGPIRFDLAHGKTTQTYISLGQSF